VRRKWVIGAAAVAVITVIVVAAWPGEKEPEYQGKKLSEWMAVPVPRQEMYLRWVILASREDVAEAIRHIGTNALPYLVKSLHYEETAKWRMNLYRTYSKLPDWSRMAWVTKKLVPNPERGPRAAVSAFNVLRAEAAPAIPALFRLSHDQNSSTAGCARDALSVIPNEIVAPWLAEKLENPDAELRKWAETDLVDLCMKEVVTGSKTLLQHTNPIVQKYASNTFSWLKPETMATNPAVMKIYVELQFQELIKKSAQRE